METRHPSQLEQKMREIQDLPLAASIGSDIPTASTAVAIISPKTDFAAELSHLATKRKNWEKNKRKTLYQLLSSCFDLLRELGGNDQHMSQLKNFLKAEQIAVRADSSDALLLIRAVFGDCGPKAFGYKTVIETAQAEKPDAQNLEDFIKSRGGIEAMRRAAMQTTRPDKDEVEDYRELVAAFKSRDHKKSDIVLSEHLETDREGFAVILVHQDKSGNEKLVFSSAEWTALKPILKRALQDALQEGDG